MKQGAVKKLEDRISQLESQVSERDSIMLDPEKCQEKMNDQAWLAEYQKLQQELEKVMKEWTIACEKLEQI